MKRTIATVLALMLVAVCLPRVEAGEKKKIAVITKAMDHEFWQTLKQGALDGAKELGTVDLTIMAPDREVNVQQQIQIIEDLVVRGVDAMAIAPCGASEMIPVLDKVNDDGVPVILIDTDAPWERKKSYIGTNNRAGGRMAGEYIAKALNGKGKVGIITGILGHQTHADRLGGCEDVLKEYPDIEIVSIQPANAERAIAMTVMENMLTAFPDLDIVFCTNAPMTLGAYEAIAAERSPCRMMAFDLEKDLLQLIKEGKVMALVAQDPYAMGKMGVEYAYKVANGETVDKLIDVPSALVDQSNVDEYIK